MKSLMKHPQVLGIIGGLLFLLALATGSTAYAASYTNNVHLVSHVEPPVPPVYTLKLHDAAGMAVHAENGITKPKVYTNGHSVNVTLAGKTYVVNPSDIKNYWLEVTIPREINLDLKVQ